MKMLFVVLPPLRKSGSPIQVNTSFASPRVPDPINAYKLEAWKIPTCNQQQDILRVLHTCMHPKAVNFLSPYIIVELYVDEHVYANHPLPGRVAGCTTVYHRSNFAFWQGMEGMKPHTRERLINPNSSVRNTTNYLEKSSRDLTPGIRVVSAPFTNPFTDKCLDATVSYPSTACVSLRNSDGQVKLTVANRGVRTTGGNIKDGIYGARIVEDDEMGGVAGFFQLADNEMCLSPLLDEIIDRGWALLSTYWFSTVIFKAKRLGRFSSFHNLSPPCFLYIFPESLICEPAESFLSFAFATLTK